MSLKTTLHKLFKHSKKDKYEELRKAGLGGMRFILMNCLDYYDYDLTPLEKEAVIKHICEQACNDITIFERIPTEKLFEDAISITKSGGHHAK